MWGAARIPHPNIELKKNERERERERVCVSERERVCESMCVCERERKREVLRVNVCLLSPDHFFFFPVKRLLPEFVFLNNNNWHNRSAGSLVVARRQGAHFFRRNPFYKTYKACKLQLRIATLGFFLVLKQNIKTKQKILYVHVKLGFKWEHKFICSWFTTRRILYWTGFGPLGLCSTSSCVWVMSLLWHRVA